jgi:hypothetical protein
MNSDDIISPEWHREFLKSREKAIKNGTDWFIDWEEAKRMILEETGAGEGIQRGIDDLNAGRTTSSEEFFEEFFSRYNIPSSE